MRSCTCPPTAHAHAWPCPQTGTTPVLCTKFAPLPWRQTPGSLVGACKKSLARLGVSQVGLYIQHWPGFFLNALSNDAFLEGLAQAWEQGLCKAVGVSNFNKQVRAGGRGKAAWVGGGSSVVAGATPCRPCSRRRPALYHGRSACAARQSSWRRAAPASPPTRRGAPRAAGGRALALGGALRSWASAAREPTPALPCTPPCPAGVPPLPQVQYSLIYRAPEQNGVLEACRENGVTLVAYSPLCQGLLTGKYSPANKPTGPRAQLFTEQRYRDVQVRGAGRGWTQVALRAQLPQ